MLIPISSLHYDVEPNNNLESLKLLKFDTNIDYYIIWNQWALIVLIKHMKEHPWFIYHFSKENCQAYLLWSFQKLLINIDMPGLPKFPFQEGKSSSLAFREHFVALATQDQ